MYRLRCEMVTERSIEDTFKIFQDPGNLGKITPSWLNFQVVTKNVEMRRGAEIDYVIKWLGLPLKWKTIIHEYEPPYFFMDEQARGPYSYWHHRHTFEETPEGTKVGDQVDYALPFGIFGELAHMLVVRHQLMAIFRHRQTALGEMLGGKTMQTVAPYIEKFRRAPSGSAIPAAR